MANTIETRPSHRPSLAPLLTKFRPTDAERERLAAIIAEVEACERQLDTVNHDATRHRLRAARGELITTGKREAQELLQAEARILDDSLELRRAAKARLRHLGKEAAGVILGVLQRAIPVVEVGLGNHRREAETRLGAFFAPDEVAELVAADPVTRGLKARLAEMTASRDAMRGYAVEGWRVYSSTIRRALGPEFSALYFGAASKE